MWVIRAIRVIMVIMVIMVISFSMGLAPLDPGVCVCVCVCVTHRRVENGVLVIQQHLKVTEPVFHMILAHPYIQKKMLFYNDI